MLRGTIFGKEARRGSLYFFNLDTDLVETYTTREEALAATAAQLRYKSILSTMQYDQAPIEDRRKVLERQGKL